HISGHGRQLAHRRGQGARAPECGARRSAAGQGISAGGTHRHAPTQPNLCDQLTGTPPQEDRRMDHGMEPPAGRNHRILVTGGTGTLGRRVVPRLRDAGCTVRVLSRGSREGAEGLEFVTGDLGSGEGVGAAVAGTEIIVHLAGSGKGDQVKARHLVGAASRAGTRHLVHIPVVGAGRVPVVSAIARAMFGYFAAKRAAEQVIADAGLPWTTLRATQFHDLTLLTVRQLARLPVLPVPAGFRFQPIDAGEVAARLVELILGAPAGLVPHLGGPRAHNPADLVRSHLSATHRHRPILPVWTPGGAARALRAGANLAPDRAVGHRPWEDFLADRLSSQTDSSSPAVRSFG